MPEGVPVSVRVPRRPQRRTWLWPPLIGPSRATTLSSEHARAVAFDALERAGFEVDDLGKLFGFDTIGSESVAVTHESNGNPVLARIHRLTPEQARGALVYLAGRAPHAFAEALDDR